MSDEDPKANPTPRSEKKLVAIVLICSLIVVLAGWILSDTVFSLPYATTAQMNGPQRDLAGKTLKYRGRFGGAYREDADGFAFHLEREIGGRMMVCLRRESPHPELKYGDPIVVTISFTSEGVAIADRIDRR